jgi:hypothetical protein
MASIIKASINLNNIDKSKIIDGKKGKYLQQLRLTMNQISLEIKGLLL